MLDIVVIGAGPAGLSAAISARQRNKTVKVISNRSKASWLEKAERIDNYPGLPEVSGREMLNVFEKQAKAMDVEIIGGLVRQIIPSDKGYLIGIDYDYIEAHSIILALGATQPKTLRGEAEYMGRGVSYCGTCDGMLYRGKKIAVIAESEEGLHEANYLSQLTNDIYLYSKLPDQENVNTMIKRIDRKPVAIAGHMKVEALKTEEEELAVDGVFIFRDSVPTSSLIDGLEMEGAYIKVNKKMETNLPGIFAAGDCTGKPLQIAKAVGEGNVAALMAADYLDHLLPTNAV